MNFGPNIPEKVYLKEPTGTIWVGKYDKSTGKIEGVQNMICFYGMTKYNLSMLQYVGDCNFNLYIFNSNAVEIEYPFGYIVDESGREVSEHQKDKIAMQFKFSAYTNPCKMYELKIEKKHLQTNVYNKV